jgi:cytochrome c-type biogenesis protein CcmF
VRGQTRSVSKPYYDFFLHTFGIPLILLMGIGPLVAWRKASLRSLGKTFLIPFAAALVTGGILLGLGFDSSWAGLLAYTFSAFVLASIVLEFVRGRVAAGGIFRLVSRNRRRYGGYLVHAAVVLLAIGVAGSSAYQTIRESHIRPGQSMEIAGYTATYRTVTGVKGPDYTGFRSLLTVTGHGESFTVDPGMNNYDAGVGPSNEASIYHDPRTLGDFFATAQLVDAKTGTIDLKLYVKPLINLIWAGGFLFVFGALVAMWPDAVEQRRLAARYAAGAAPAGI